MAAAAAAARSIPDRISRLAHGVPDAFLEVRRTARPPRVLLFVGQWLPMKGTAYLARAFDELAGRYPELTLVCAGTLVPPGDMFERELGARS